MMPPRGSGPRASSTVSWTGLARPPATRTQPALHNANLGDRLPGCPHSAPPNSPGHPLLTAAFFTVTAFAGAPSVAPPTTPAAPTASTTDSPASSILPNGVYDGGSLLSL
ncbi:hypothetical protein SAMN05444921_117124 [Streptomyces wuyuanensis]|uniref:Uncharacterized protein n=1 Tax=Streptomyces wuyuanensis TaxID=1196353 RepID=A0A1G9Y2B8_9ACTN|nr:hypothetical protein SAMN05444921_117124 [Streptomyces wuyuanensis]